ncbi:MAG: SH3 domain-containing protein [Sulfitobacter sp.]
MRMLALLLCLLAGIGTASGVLADTRIINSPADGYLNLRSGPGVEFRLLGRMINGTSAEVTGQEGDWLRLRHETGTTGWAHGDYLKKVQPVRGMLQFVNSPADGYLNMRRGPGQNFGVKKQLLHAGTVTVLTVDGNWTKVKDDKGTRGWVYNPYLSMERPGS